MSIMIRLKRIGTHKRPFYTIVAVDSRKKRDGRVLEILGRYDPRGGGKKVTFFEEKIKAWTKKGALVSPTVRSLLKIHKEK
ncbi:MAG: 30S ribosomal protein S16 [Elusimicrobiota bacterium]|nr:30S ribosomal protein S16 [Elusimicrobiota bacterium]